MEAVKAILKEKGYSSVSEMDINESVNIEMDGFTDLYIEKTGESQLSVAHYYTQRGDLMADPEIVFDVDEDWTPIEFIQHPNIHHANKDGLSEVADFAGQWSSNLVDQGFVEKATEVSNV